jgi:hypothetical protein
LTSIFDPASASRFTIFSKYPPGETQMMYETNELNEQTAQSKWEHHIRTAKENGQLALAIDLQEGYLETWRALRNKNCPLPAEKHDQVWLENYGEALRAIALNEQNKMRLIT